MILSQGTQYRSFSAQNNFSFYFDVTNSSTSGNSSIGFSGNSGLLPLFYFESGNILDLNRKNVWAYNPRETITFSGNISSGSVNYFINQNPVCLHAPKNNYYYNNFYINTNNSEISYNFYVAGTPPQYSIIFPSEVRAGDLLTGFIKNQESGIEKSFKIFSGNIFNQNTIYSLVQYPTAYLSGGQSGQIILDGSGMSGFSFTGTLPSLFNLQFVTNFGDTLDIIPINLLPPFSYYLEFITGYTGITGFTEDKTYGKIYNYELRSIYPNNQNTSILLQNISGHTGQIVYDQFQVSGNLSGIISSFVYGFEYVTGRLTGVGTSWYQRDYYGQYPTGILSYSGSQFQYATGNINYYYNLPLYGGSGTGASPSGTQIIGSGILTGAPITGFVFGIGIYSGNRDISATGYYYNSPNYISGNLNTYGSGYYTGNWNVNFRKFLWSAYITGARYLTSTFANKIYNITGKEYDNGFGTTTGRSGVISNYSFEGVKIFDSSSSENLIRVSSQPTGNLLLSRILEKDSIFTVSGSGFSSENNSSAGNAFTGNNYFYLTGATGDIGFSFINYSLQDKEPIYYYTFDLDFNSTKYPYEFYLQLRSGGAWTTIDSKTGYNFYEYSSKILECNAPNQNINIQSGYDAARIYIASTANWPHTPITNRSNGIGIKSINLFSKTLVWLDTTYFSTTLDVLTGYGYLTGINTNMPAFVDISNPTGMQPAVFYTTGLLTGFINSGSGFYRWNNTSITGTGITNRVYLNYITGYKQASNIIQFIDSTGYGLRDYDIINIGDFIFTYKKDLPSNPSEFNSPQNLINILNSGATGAYNEIGYGSLQSSVGVTGYQSSNKLFLYSYYRNGADGNNLRIYRDSNDLSVISIYSRYFTGGQTYRPPLSSWTGSFSGNFNLEVENSGNYSFEFGPVDVFNNITGVGWVDTFSGNYYIYTGMYSQSYPENYSGVIVNFNTGLNSYSGATIIPSGQILYTGLIFQIQKPNPYNISGNRSKYIISGNNFIFSGLIEG